ncbi:hypothetical protein H2200_009611 [Cladophialophora chaetospira]|uniref:non-specific serine/threonine protein kinase n=1 Tax=Cladophialophora chaetospira TaxID=386627 RepID=A0AA38X330_9EURO|nr:hypothetical protein H2200_009611 [Cladophialophora chaetospira]
MAPLPDLVKDAEYHVHFEPGLIEHVYYESGRAIRRRKLKRPEKWKAEERLGAGSFGTVWRQKLLSPPGTNNGTDRYRAIKEIKKDAPGNILVASCNPEWRVKIADFGVSKRAVEGQTGLRTLIGTPGFLAPEIILLKLQDGSTDPIGDNKYSFAVDIWALGEVSFRCLTGKGPFAGQNVLDYYQGKMPFPLAVLEKHGISQRGCTFLALLLAADPNDRCAADVALEHSWLLEGGTSSSSSFVELEMFTPTALEHQEVLPQTDQSRAADHPDKSAVDSGTEAKGAVSAEHQPKFQSRTGPSRWGCMIISISYPAWQKTYRVIIRLKRRLQDGAQVPPKRMSMNPLIQLPRDGEPLVENKIKES